MSVELRVNGQTVRVAVDATTLLLDVLRNELGLRGSRYGCGLEQCGSCMVLIDGEPSYSCAREVGSVAGRSITTIEGLGTPEAPHVLQRGFLQEQAGQCGYCLSGTIISAAALLARVPRPSRAQIVAALDKHLCRCGTQRKSPPKSWTLISTASTSCQAIRRTRRTKDRPPRANQLRSPAALSDWSVRSCARGCYDAWRNA
jgi:nicotinate dehydrogenase subunit A